MVVADWLKPVYEGIAEIVVDAPVRLSSWSELLATCNRDTAATLQHDRWVDEHDPVPFASVRALGDGFVVFIAGGVSSDSLLERCPDNTGWLVSIARFLADEVDKGRSRQNPLRGLQDAVEAARARARVLGDEEAAGDAYAAELKPALLNAGRKLPAERLQQARAAMEQHFGEDWPSLGEDARSFLITGEVFNAKFRNRAAHLDRLTLQECVAARAYLLDEPTQLLMSLVRGLRRT